MLSDTLHVVFSAPFILPRREDKDVCCSMKGIRRGQYPRENNSLMGCLSPSQATWKLAVALVFLVPHWNKIPSLTVLNGLTELRESEHTQPPHPPSHQPEHRLAQSAECSPGTQEPEAGGRSSRFPSLLSEFQVSLGCRKPCLNAKATKYLGYASFPGWL